MKVIALASFNSYYCNQIAYEARKAGLPLDAIVYVGDTVDAKSRRIHREYTGHHEGYRITDLEELEIPTYIVKRLNSKATLHLLRRLAPDVILQAGSAGILRKPIIEIPSIGILNSHPGILPHYRGCMAVEWSIYNNDELGATCHFIDEGIDSGPIILTRRMTVRRGMSYHEIRTKAFYHGVNVLLEGLRMVLEGFRIENATSHKREGRYYKPMTQEERQTVIEKVESGRYRHLVD